MSNLEINQDEPYDSSPKRIGNRVFLIFLIIGFLILAGCIFQNQTEKSNGNGEATTSDISDKDSKNGYVGKFYSTLEGSQYDDYFQTVDAEYGIEAVATPIIIKLNEVKDTEKEIIIWGELVKDVPDYAGQQIIVNKIKIPADNFELEWQSYKNEDLGISFQCPKYAVFEVTGNSINFDGWALEILNNPKSLELEPWLNSNFSGSESESCQLTTTTDISLGGYPTYKVSLGEGGAREEIGIFAMTEDKQRIIKLMLTEHPSQDYKEIIKTLRFIKTLSKDEVDLNETKKNGETDKPAGLANPASVYCGEQGGRLEIRTDEKTSGQYGVCIFSNKSECEEWAFYRGECQAGDK